MVLLNERMSIITEFKTPAMKRTCLTFSLAAALSTAAFLQSCNQMEEAAKPVAPAGEELKTAASDHGTYQLVSALGGKTAEIANFALTDSVKMHLGTYTGAAHQLWRVQKQGTAFKIMNTGSGKYAQSALISGTQQLIQNFLITGNTQLWNIASAGNGYYKITNKANGLALTNADTGNVTLATYANNNTQWWSFTQLEDKAYRDDQVVNFFHRKHGSISFDQGNSIPLSYGPNAGKVLWIAEDTYTEKLLKPNGKFNCPQFFDIHNSALLQPASHSWNEAETQNVISHNSIYDYEFIASPGEHNSSFTWPGVGIEIGNHVYMYAYEGPKSNGFDKSVIYDFTENATGGLDWGTGVRHEVAGVSDQTKISYSVGMVKPGDGYVYAYGAKTIFLFKNIFVARFAESDPFTWTFWNGSTWAAAPVFTSVAAIHFIGHDDGTLANTAVSYVNGKYVMMQMDLGYFCDNTPHSIYTSTASSVTGPFTDKVEVFSIEDRLNGHLCNYYTPCIHPQFDNGQDELLLTYCLNYTACSVSTCTNGYLDPNYYQVKAIRVPYARIGL